MIEKRRLGRTDLEVTAICLGTMTFGEQNNEAEGHAQLDRAVAAGINFIDTAEIYAVPPRRETQGATERIIGSWLAARGGRDKLVIATKVAGRGRSDWMRPDGKGTRLDEANITYAVEHSLRRLASTPAGWSHAQSDDFAMSTLTIAPRKRVRRCCSGVGEKRRGPCKN